MTRRTLLTLPLAAAANSQDTLAQARAIHATSLGVDSHLDTAQRVLMENLDLSKRHADGHVDIPRLKEGGVRAPFFALWVPVYYKGSEAVRRTLQLHDAMLKVFAAHPGQIALARNASEIESLAKAGRIAAVLTLEGGHQIADDLAVLRTYQHLGIRSMTLTHFRNNNWADASTDKPVHNGLTAFGKDVVREMNRIGMIVDISHVSDKTFFDTLAVTSKPVIASHSSCRALSPVPRNMSDEMIGALSRNGGVISINFGEGFIHPKDAEALMRAVQSVGYSEPALSGAALDEYAKKSHSTLLKPAAVQAAISDVANHIDHAVKIAGVDHVGIGSDYDGISGPPNGLPDIGKMPLLTAELLRRGHKEDAIRKILGGNLMRVIRETCG
ncbi:MAG: dipeptidase [Bryobacteraceae bacterium]|nr:dipeptidase [Bryobacteraceae bacterium]